MEEVYTVVEVACVKKNNNKMGEQHRELWVRSMWTMTEVLFGKETSMGGEEEECVTKCKR